MLYAWRYGLLGDGGGVAGKGGRGEVNELEDHINELENYCMCTARKVQRWYHLSGSVYYSADF